MVKAKSKSSKKIYLIFLLVILITAARYLQEHNSLASYDLTGKNTTCPLEYGYSECINGKIYTPFYNPNNVSIENVKVLIPKPNGVDIYNVQEPLGPKEAKSLTTTDCSDEENLTQIVSLFRLRWCCNESCYEIYMNASNLNENVTLSKQ